MSKQPEDTSRQHFTDPLDALVDFVQEAGQILDMSVRGIASMTNVPGAIKVLAKVKPEEFGDEHMARAGKMARLAEQEIANDFPLLHAHTVVAMWSAMEESIPKFAAGWLVENPVTLARPSFEKIKVAVSLYEQMSMESRMAYIVDAVLQDQRAGQPGVARYEALLDAIGFGGNIHDELRRDLLELSRVGNLIVHQFSIVDARFAAACPWLDVHPGNRFNVTHRDYCRYRDAVLRYVTEIAWRVAEAKGHKREDNAVLPATRPKEEEPR